MTWMPHQHETIIKSECDSVKHYSVFVFSQLGNYLEICDRTPLRFNCRSRRRQPVVQWADLLTSDQLDRLVVVLVSTRNPLNIGAAARAMSNFGLPRLRVVNPYPVAYRYAKSAVGAGPVLEAAEEFTTVAEAVADCRLAVGTTAGTRREPEHVVQPLAAGAAEIGQALDSGRVALLFGSEKRGLTNEDLSHCHWLMYIPTQNAQRSMNLGQAVAVCLYELTRTESGPVAAEEFEPATAGDLERLTALLFGALRTSGYLKPQPDVEAEEKLRRLVYRLRLNAADATVLLGMVRKMVRKMGSGE